MQSKHFFAGFDFPRHKSNRAVVYLNNECFASIWQMAEDFPNAGRWTINRDFKALELGFPACKETFLTLTDLFAHLENWWATQPKG
jgi:hypothetical protein